MLLYYHYSSDGFWDGSPWSNFRGHRVTLVKMVLSCMRNILHQNLVCSCTTIVGTPGLWMMTFTQFSRSRGSLSWRKGFLSWYFELASPSLVCRCTMVVHRPSSPHFQRHTGSFQWHRPLWRKQLLLDISKYIWYGIANFDMQVVVGMVPRWVTLTSFRSHRLTLVKMVYAQYLEKYLT